MTEPPHANLVIRASAGSGKTFRMTNRYLALIAAGVPPSQIWAATFTRKAAGEILDRILSRLTDAASSESLARTLAKQIGLPALNRSDFVRMLRTVLAELPRLRIGTLDSLFLLLAGAFSFELGLPPGWGIVDEDDALAAREEALDAALDGDADRLNQLVRLYERLSAGAARRAVRDDLFCRVNSLYSAYLTVPEPGWQTQIPPTPTGNVNDIIDEAKRIDLPPDKRFPPARDKDFDFATRGRWSDFINGGLAHSILTGKSTYYGKPIPGELVRCYERLIAIAKHAIHREWAIETAAVREFLDEYHRHFAVAQNSGRSLRFDDVTRVLAQRLRPDAEGFDYRIDCRIGHLLLDEFQDTSTLQWRALKPLATQTMSTGGSIFGVGDVKQAIYNWRGGRSELLDRLPTELGGVATESMDHSWRSSQAVIDCVNRVFSHLAENVDDEQLRQAAVDWQRRFQTHTTERADRRGYVRLETGPAQKDGESSSELRGRHCAWVAGQLASIVAEKPTASVGVLCRTNKGVGRMIYELRKLGIAASEEGGNPITDSPAVEGILSLMTLADHPGDSVAAFHLANEPFAAMLSANHFDIANPDVVARQVRFRLVQEGYGAVVAGCVRSLKSCCPRADCERLEQLTELADAYESRATLRPAEFASWVRRYKAVSPTSCTVRVLTLHKSKGLEFDAVVLPELDVQLREQRPPDFIVAEPDPPELSDGFVGRRVVSKLRAIASEQAKLQTDFATRRAIEESYSVLYVALTRARDALYAYPPGPMRKSHPPTWDTVILRALCATRPIGITDRLETSLLLAEGDPNWTPEKPVATTAASATPKPIRFAKSDPAIPHGEWATPSLHHEIRRATVADLFRQIDPATRATGQLYHAWFAAIDWLDHGEPAVESLMAIARKMLYEGTDLPEQIASFQRSLRQPAVKALLSQGHYPVVVSVETERPFAVRAARQLIAGRLDRFVLFQDSSGSLAAEVIDYKTDDIPLAAVPERVNYYRSQMEAYFHAVSAFAHVPAQRVTGALVFTALGHIERLSLLGETSPESTVRI